MHNSRHHKISMHTYIHSSSLNPPSQRTHDSCYSIAYILEKKTRTLKNQQKYPKIIIITQSSPSCTKLWRKSESRPKKCVEQRVLCLKVIRILFWNKSVRLKVNIISDIAIIYCSLESLETYVGLTMTWIFLSICCLDFVRLNLPEGADYLEQPKSMSTELRCPRICLT